MTIRKLPLVIGFGCALLPLAVAPGFIGTASAGVATFDATRAAAGDPAGRRPFAQIASPAAAVSVKPHGGMPADWHALGPFGGDVADVAASPTAVNVVLAGIAPSGGAGGGGTLYRSVDGAATWSAVPALAHSVLDIEFDTNGKAYLAVDNGVWSSSDDGASWTQHDLGIGPNQWVMDVAVDPANPLIVWAGIADAFGAQAVNVAKSVDGGVHWTDSTPPHPAAMTCTGIAIDPANPSHVAAVFGGWTGGAEAWVTTDGGVSWTDRSAGLPGNPLRAAAFAGTRLLVGGGQLFGAQYVGLYGSSDLGANWIQLDDASWPIPVVSDIAVDPHDAQTILVSIDGAGVNRSTDGGATWQIAVGGTASLAVQSLRFVPGSSSQLLLGASSLGVYRSTDSATQFTPASTGISELSLYAIDTSQVDANQLAVAFQGNNNGGVLTSADGGAHWSAEPVPATRYSNVRFAPDGTLYAMSSGPTSIAPEGLYRREGDGSWTNIGPDQGPWFESDLVAIRFSAGDPNLILLGGADYGVAGDQSTIWRSTDAGQSWSKQFQGGSGEKVVDIESSSGGSDQNLVAVYDGYQGDQLGGALHSIDGGLAWTPALHRLPAFARFPRLCASAATPGTVYMSMWDSWSTGAIYRTDDNGDNWTPTGWAGGNAIDIACDQHDAQVLYVAQNGVDPVLRSADQGATFAAFSTGLEGAGTLTGLALSKIGAPLLYLGGTHGSFVTARSDVPDVILANGFD